MATSESCESPRFPFLHPIFLLTLVASLTQMPPEMSLPNQYPYSNSVQGEVMRLARLSLAGPPRPGAGSQPLH
jgi:hypothetical protein